MTPSLRFDSDRRLDLFCADPDREIDRLVYQLYELTDDEIGMSKALPETISSRAKPCRR